MEVIRDNLLKMLADPHTKVEVITITSISVVEVDIAAVDSWEVRTTIPSVEAVKIHTKPPQPQ